jgi:hypothetical protein
MTCPKSHPGNKKFYVVKTFLKSRIVRQGGRFEFTTNKLFKFHDVIARLHVYYGDGVIERTKNIHCAQIEDYEYDHFVHTIRYW